MYTVVNFMNTWLKKKNNNECFEKFKQFLMFESGSIFLAGRIQILYYNFQEKSLVINLNFKL